MKASLINQLNTSELLLAAKNGTIIESCAALCEIARRKNASCEVSSFLYEMKADNRKFWNTYLISDFAEAAMHLLGIQKYNGNRIEVKNLIHSDMVFE